MKVLMLTSEWPTLERPELVPFIVDEVTYLREAGIQVDVYNFNGGFNITNYLAAWRRVHNKLHQEHYDLVHAQFGQNGLVALFPKTKPLIVTFRGSDLNGMYNQRGRLTGQGRLLKTVSQYVARCADQVIVVSERLAGSLRNRSYRLIPTGIDLQRFIPMQQSDARRALSLNPDTRYVLFAGEIKNPIKRFSLAQQVIEFLDDPQVEMLVADGVNPVDMPLYFNAADALLLTSIREGSPTVIKEALACNLPVVSVDVGDVQWLVKDIEGCHVVKNAEPGAFAVLLKSVLQRGSRVEGRQAALPLDIRVSVKLLVETYQQVLGVAH